MATMIYVHRIMPQTGAPNPSTTSATKKIAINVDYILEIKESADGKSSEIDFTLQGGLGSKIEVTESMTELVVLINSD